MQNSRTIFAIMLVLALTVTLLTGADFGADAGGSSWLASTAMAQAVPAEDAAPEAPATDAEGPVIPTTPGPASKTSTGYSNTVNVLAFIALTLVVPYFLGIWFAGAIRLPDMGRRVGLVLATLACSIAICFVLWPPKFGIDLQGGIILIYEVDEEASIDLLATNAGEDAGESTEQLDRTRLKEGTAQLIQQLQKRINPGGVSEVVIRPYGENQVEVQVPLAESADLDSIKRRITKAGVLDFMILANAQDHQYLLERAQEPSQKAVRFVTDRRGKRIGRWVRVEKERAYVVGGYDPSATDLTPMLNGDQHLVRGGGPGLPLEVLMKVEPPEWQLGGSQLRGASVERDEVNRPAIGFSFNTDGARRMGRLTQNNLTEANTQRNLGIVMDDVLISAPRIQGVISSEGKITGDFSQTEASDLAQVLKAGKLPVVLRKEPISEQTISATLGDDTIRKGQIAISISLIAVLIFMVIYYRVAGLVACFALLFNLVLVLAIMIALKADLTLPGIAGLVLTVGMSVDANVLIFERIREELNGGASLKVALNNGFSKAMSTIVDANITTLITAAVLYRIGTDQVRGFAVTLFVGILMSMFTAIFVSRVFFEIMERKRLVKTLNFMPSASSIGYDFIGKQKVAAIFSIAIILVGMIGVGVRGRGIFDIDFNGGSSVQVYLTEQMAISEVRSKLNNVLPDLSVSAVSLPGAEGRVFKVDTSLAEYGELGKVVMTDRTGKSAEVELKGINSLNQIIKTLDAADVGIAVTPNANGDGIEFTDATNSASGEMSVKNFDDKTETASNLRMNFKTDALRYNTGQIPAGVDVVQEKIEQVFTGPNGESMLVMHSMDFTPPKAEEGPSVSTPLGAAGPTEISPENPESPMTPAEEKPTDEKPEATPMPEPMSDEAAKPEETPESNSEPAPEPMTEEKPAEEKPAEEKPAEEKPAEEKPAEEKPAEEKPAEEKPAPEGDMQSSLIPSSSNLLAMLPWQLATSGILQEEGTPEKPMEEAPPAEEKPAEEKPAEEPAAQPMAEPMPMEQPAPMADPAPMAETPPVQTPPIQVPGVNTQIPGGGNMFSGGQLPSDTSRFASETELSFDDKISADTLRTLIKSAADQLAIQQPLVGLLDAQGELLPPDSGVSQETWTIKMSTGPEESGEILATISKQLDSTPVWPSSSKIGSKVAGDMQTMAILAILFCLIGIVGYIWFRFQSVAFGVAAVVALVHDVLVTLGFIALSMWLAPALGFLQVTEFKISLPVVAAFLTIIGYSLNDTIVIFDRIREVRGKDPHLTPEMINLSVNQTLGRTLLTSITTLIVVLILYFIGGEGIHSFSFSLVVGVIAGTYSTVFIACPVLLWLMNRDQKTAGSSKSAKKAKA